MLTCPNKPGDLCSANLVGCLDGTAGTLAFACCAGFVGGGLGRAEEVEAVLFCLGALAVDLRRAIFYKMKKNLDQPLFYDENLSARTE